MTSEKLSLVKGVPDPELVSGVGKGLITVVKNAQVTGNREPGNKKMKQLIIISALIFTGASLSAQTNMRASKMDVVAEKNEGSKAKEDVLYGKTVEGQDKGLVFRQSVLDETNTKAEEKREMMATEEKLKLLNNNKTATKTQNKPN